MQAVFLFYLGAGLSFLPAVAVGIVVSTWVAYRDMSRGRGEPAAAPNPAANATTPPTDV